MLNSITKIKTHLLLLIIFLFGGGVYAQNLVNNWSFEDTVACPVGVTQISKAVGWDSYRASPDYFNYCNSTLIGVPSNFMGFQHARTGIAYAGLITFAKYATNIREIIGSALNQQLAIGQTYYISFHVSRAYSAAYFNNMATDKIGLKFSTVPYSIFSPIPVNDTAHIYTNTIVTDTTNWVKISGTFTADSAYNYFAIGNFFTDSIVSRILIDSVGAVAYYYIDDVCISLDSNYCNSLTGLEKTDSNNPFAVYPNPADNFLLIEGIGFSEIEIYNDVGKLMFNQNYNKLIYKTQVDLAVLNSGFYLIKIKTPNSYYTKKIIINKK